MQVHVLGSVVSKCYQLNGLFAARFCLEELGSSFYNALLLFHICLDYIRGGDFHQWNWKYKKNKPKKRINV